MMIPVVQSAVNGDRKNKKKNKDTGRCQKKRFLIVCDS